MQKNTLIDLGFSKNEVLVYETLLRGGELFPVEIAANSGLSRVNVYGLLKGLVAKGVVEEFSKKKKLCYRLEPPQRLLDYAEARKKSMEESEKSLASLLPGLTAEYNLGRNKPGIAYYEGIAGIKKIYADILKEKEDIFIIASKYDRDQKEVNDFLDEHIKKQAKAGIKTQAIVSRKFAKNQQAVAEAASQGIAVKSKIPPKIDLEAQILIYGDKVVITSFKGKIISTLIQNKGVAQTFLNIFKMLWTS